jgi:hypothetical protein
MESTAKPAPYFAAYPLKAVKESNVNNLPPTSPYLRALLSGARSNRSPLKVLPMINSPRVDRMTAPSESRLPHDIELTEKTWFCSYE